MAGTLFPIDEPVKQAGLRLRGYQEACRNSIVDVLKEEESCLAVMATGTGKTETAMSVITQIDPNLEGTIWCTPFRDLVVQTAARLRKNGIPCSIEMAGLRSYTPVTVACYDSLLSRKRYEQFVGSTKLLIVDESHLKYTKRAIQMIGYFREAGTKVLALTATPARTVGDPLTKFYGRVAFDYPYRSALRDGFLVPTKVWLAVIESLDLSECNQNRSDFTAEDLGKIMAKEKTVHAIASLVAQHHDGDPSVVFCASIRQSEMLREVLARHDINSCIVHSQMDEVERRQHLSDFEDGTCNIIINVGCLTTGWDHAPVRKLFIARPTKSRALYQQMFGRAIRPLTGVVDGYGTAEQRRKAIADSEKPHCEIFDITDTTRMNDLQSAVDVYEPDLEPKLMRRVRRRLETATRADSPEDVDAVVEAERKALAQEEAAKWALEEEKRRRVKAHAQFRIFERDPFARAERDWEDDANEKRRGWRMLFGKHKGWPLKDVPTGYLKWVVEKSNCRNRAFLGAVSRELADRLCGERGRR